MDTNCSQAQVMDGGTIPDSAVVVASDFVLLHGNGVGNASQITAMVEATKKVNRIKFKTYSF